MQPPERDEEREDRIRMEAIVDAYGPEEQAMGWYYYLQDRLTFPFEARCISERTISPLRKGETVQILDMAGEGECQSEMFVLIDWQGRKMGVPLDQLVGVEVDEDTEEAIGDWHYWRNCGYQFG